MPELTYWLTSGTGNKITNHMRGPKRRPWPGDITGHGMGYGVMGKIQDAWRQTEEKGYRWLYADGPYFLRRKVDSCRLAWRGQWFVLCDGPERTVKSLEVKGVHLKDRNPGATVFVCPSHDIQHKRHSQESAAAWVKRTTALVRQYTDRPIEVRTKGSSSDLRARIADMDRVFARAWAIVTSGSTIGCEALAAGVPVITDRRCAASPLATPLDDIDDAQITGDRDWWAHNLAARQFDTVELRSGHAWDVMKEDLAFVESR